MQRTLINLLFLVPLALWSGAAVGLTFLTTPVVFATLDRDAAAGLVGQLFPGYFRFGLICLTLSLVAVLVGQWRHGPAPTGWRRWAVPATLAVTLLIMLYAGLVLEPQVAAVQARITSFVTETDSPARQEFRRLHSLSSLLNVAGLLLIALVWVLTAISPGWLSAVRSQPVDDRAATARRRPLQAGD